MESNPFKAHMTVAEAMLRDKYVSNHKFEEDPTYSEFVHEVESFFTQRPNLESLKIKRFLEWVVQNQEIFEKKHLKIAIALFKDLEESAKVDLNDIIQKLAQLSERDFEESEREDSIIRLLFEVNLMKDKILEEFELICPSHEISIEKKQVTTLIVEKKKPKRKKAQRCSFIVEEQNHSSPREKKEKIGLSSKQRIISVLQKKKNFVIYDQSVPLPQRIKRIRLNACFEAVLFFIEGYVIDEGLSVDIVKYEGKAEIRFEVQKNKPKSRYKIKKHIYVA